MSKNIINEIESGQYFEESHKWYFSKYVNDHIYQSWLMLACTVMWALAILCSISIYSLANSDNNIKSLLLADYDVFNKNIKNIQCNDHDITKSLTKILVHNYIIQREKYDDKNLSTQYNYIKDNSNELVFSKFKKYMNLSNPISPIKRYNHATRQINITRSRIDYASNTAVIIFNSKAFNDVGNIFEDIDWQADIKFYRNTNNLATTSYPINIIGYKLKTISDNL